MKTVYRVFTIMAKFLKNPPRDLRERFGNFESLLALFFAYWGIGLCYYSNCRMVIDYFPSLAEGCSLSEGYLFFFKGLGIYLTVLSVRMLIMNPIKRRAHIEQMLTERMREDYKKGIKP